MDMAPGWQDEIDAAQEFKVREILGADISAIAYGPDDPDLDVRPQCSDSGGVGEIGELHVPGCCVERCPRCGDQALSCTCIIGYDA